MRKNAIYIAALIMSAAVFVSCNSTDLPQEETAESINTETETAETTETEEETQADPIIYELSQGEADMINIFTIPIYNSLIETEAIQADSYTVGKKNVKICDISLLTGGSIRLEFDDSMASSGIFYLIEPADENNVSPHRLFDIVSGELCIGASDNSPYTSDDFASFAQTLCGSTVTAAEDEVVLHRLMKVYTAESGNGNYEKVAFDDFMRNSCGFANGEWSAIN